MDWVVDMRGAFDGSINWKDALESVHQAVFTDEERRALEQILGHWRQCASHLGDNFNDDRDVFDWISGMSYTIHENPLATLEQDAQALQKFVDLRVAPAAVDDLARGWIKICRVSISIKHGDTK